MHVIKENRKLAPTIATMIVDAPYIAQHRKAGQFVIIRIDERGERFPLTIVDSDSGDGTITLFYQIVGTSTDRLSKLGPGDSLADISGPLGHPTEIKNVGTAVCIGGGIGIATVYPIATALKDAGNKVINIIGARSKELIILNEELEKKGDELIICTDDGSMGDKGFVTDALTELINREPVNLVVSIGPVPMMKAVSDITKEKEIKTLVSLNSIMVDGTGMCGGCRVSVNGKKMFTCVDGPEFDAHAVDFDELMIRLNSYKDDEKVSHEKYKHQCKLNGLTDD